MWIHRRTAPARRKIKLSNHMETPNRNATPVDLDRLVRLYADARGFASQWRHAQRYAEVEAGKAMREAREKAGLSLRDMAKKLNVSPPFLSDMERGNRKYSESWIAEAVKIIEPNANGDGRREPAPPRQ